MSDAAKKLVELIGPEDGVAELALVDEAGKNALDAEMAGALEEALASVGARDDVKVLLVRGREDVFCSGGNKDMLVDLAKGTVKTSDIGLTRAMLEVPVPTIAVMEGHAVGGGLVFGLACDIVLMAREARFGCSFMNMGFTPGMGTTRLLQRSVGEHLAAEMMYGGQFFKGSHFENRGLINYVLPRAKLLRKARQVAARIAEKPRFALALLKSSLAIDKRQTFEHARSVETMMHEISFAHPETKALIEENY